MRKTRKLSLNRETLHHLVRPELALRDVAGGVKTIPLSGCTLCTRPPECKLTPACTP